jgi:hypothetical protein
MSTSVMLIELVRVRVSPGKEFTSTSVSQVLLPSDEHL